MGRETSHRRTPLSILSNPGQSSGDASSDHEEYFKLKEAYLKVTDLYSGASLDADKLKATGAALGIAQQEAAQAQDKKAAAKVEVQNLLVDTTAACDAAFPVQTGNDPVTTPEERFRALPACI